MGRAGAISILRSRRAAPGFYFWRGRRCIFLRSPRNSASVHPRGSRRFPNMLGVGITKGLLRHDRIVPKQPHERPPREAMRKSPRRKLANLPPRNSEDERASIPPPPGEKKGAKQAFLAPPPSSIASDCLRRRRRVFGSRFQKRSPSPSPNDCPISIRMHGGEERRRSGSITHERTRKDARESTPIHTGCISGFEMRRWPEQQHGLFWWRIEIGVVID